MENDDKNQPKQSVTGYISLPKRVDAPSLGVSMESLETLIKMQKVKRLGYIIPKGKNILDVLWISTSVWYKPSTWGKGYFTTK